MTRAIAKVIASREELESLRSEWNELLANSAADCIFLTFEWLTTWIDAVYPRAHLVVPIARDESGRLIGAAPFYQARMKVLGLIPLNVLRPMGDQFSGAEYPDFIVRKGCENETLPAMLSAMRQANTRWDLIWIPNVSGWSGAAERMSTALPESGLWHRQRTRVFAAAELPKSHDEFMSLFSSKARGNLKRDVRRLLDLDGAKVEIAEVATMDTRLDELFELHRRRWESVGQAGSFGRKPALTRFYRAFAPIAHERGWLRFWTLRTASGAIASQYGYVYNGVYSQLQEGYEPSIESAGSALRYLAIQSLIEEGCRVYDFLGGFTEHKRRWRAVQRDGWDFLIGRCTTKLAVLRYKQIWPTGRYLKPAPLPVGNDA